MLRHAGLALGLVCLSLLGAAPRARAAEFEKHLPEDTQTVAGINVRQILDSSLVKKYGLDKIKEALKSEDEVQKILKDLGFDPLKDLDSVVIAAPGGNEPDKGLIIVRGHFDLAKFQAKAEDIAKKNGDTLQIEKAGGKTIYKVVLQEQTFYASFAGPDAMLAAPAKDYLLKALERSNGKAPALKSKELQALLAKVDTKRSVWMAVAGSAFPKELPIDNEKLKKSLDSIESVTGGINVADEVKLEFQIATKDAAGAKDLVQTIKGALAQAKGFLALAGGDQLAPLVDVLGTAKATAEDKTVTVVAVISADVIEKLSKLAQ
jgi:hypothetical protein